MAWERLGRVLGRLGPSWAIWIVSGGVLDRLGGALGQNFLAKGSQIETFHLEWYFPSYFFRFSSILEFSLFFILFILLFAFCVLEFLFLFRTVLFYTVLFMLYDVLFYIIFHFLSLFYCYFI